MSEKNILEEEVVSNTIPEEKTEEQPQKYSCLNCGAELNPEQEFCTKCGIKKGDYKKITCPKCNTEVKLGEKFCPQCGEKIELKLDNVIDTVKRDYNTRVKKINFRLVKGLFILAIVIFVIVKLSQVVLPKLIVTVDELLAEGNYQEAFEKAKSQEDKERVLVENLFAYLCNDLSEGFKDPSSFDLREAWFDQDDKEIVMKVGGKNSFGGIVTSYYYFTYDSDEEKYELWVSLSDLENETISRYDDTEETLEKYLKNAARSNVKEIIAKNSLKLDKKIVDNINNLHSKDLLDQVILLDDINSLNGGSTL